MSATYLSNLKEDKMLFYFNTKYISYVAFSRDVFTEEPTLLQEYLKSHITMFCGGFNLPIDLLVRYSR